MRKVVRKWIMLLAGVAALALPAACGAPVGGAAVENTPPPTSSPVPTPTDLILPTVTVPPEEGLVTQARTDLAGRLGVDPDTIVVVEVQSVEWPDGALGCPLPGMSSTQLVTPGYQITLLYEGEPHIYHTDRAAQVVLCGPEGQPLVPPVPITPEAAENEPPAADEGGPPAADDGAPPATVEPQP